MSPRITTVKQGNKTCRYLQIVQPCRENGKNKKRILGNLGRLDLLGNNLDGCAAFVKNRSWPWRRSSGRINCPRCGRS